MKAEADTGISGITECLHDVKPTDGMYGVSYRWSMVTMRLSCTVSEI